NVACAAGCCCERGHGGPERVDGANTTGRGRSVQVTRNYIGARRVGGDAGTGGREDHVTRRREGTRAEADRAARDVGIAAADADRAHVEIDRVRGLGGHREVGAEGCVEGGEVDRVGPGGRGGIDRARRGRVGGGNALAQPRV